jgi:hypothetical protein
MSNLAFARTLIACGASGPDLERLDTVTSLGLFAVGREIGGLVDASIHGSACYYTQAEVVCMSETPCLEGTLLTRCTLP